MDLVIEVRVRWKGGCGGHLSESLMYSSWVLMGLEAESAW